MNSMVQMPCIDESQTLFEVPQDILPQILKIDDVDNTVIENGEALRIATSRVEESEVARCTDAIYV